MGLNMGQKTCGPAEDEGGAKKILYFITRTVWPLGTRKEMLPRGPHLSLRYLWHLIWASQENDWKGREGTEGRDGSCLIPKRCKSSALAIKGSGSNPSSQQRDLISWRMRSRTRHILNWFSPARLLLIQLATLSFSLFEEWTRLLTV